MNSYYCAAVNPRWQEGISYLTKVAADTRNMFFLGEIKETCKTIFFSSTKFKLKLFDKARYQVNLCEKILKKTDKLKAEVKIYHQPDILKKINLLETK